jgi:hypothetical protein
MREFSSLAREKTGCAENAGQDSPPCCDAQICQRSGSTRSNRPSIARRFEAHGFEYYRHGTLSLYAALDTRSGEILGKTAQRHTSTEFVDFLTHVGASQPLGREIHDIADNLSARQTKLVDDFPANHPQVRIHFTPTYPW